MKRGVLCLALLCGAAFAMSSEKEEDLKADFAKRQEDAPEPQVVDNYGNKIEEMARDDENKEDGQNDWANLDGPYYGGGRGLKVGPYGRPGPYPYKKGSYSYESKDSSSYSESDGYKLKAKVYRKEVDLHPDPYYPPRHPSEPKPVDVYGPEPEKGGYYPPKPYYGGAPKPYYGDSGDFDDGRAVKTKYYRDGDKICRKRCYREGYRTACHKKCYKAPSKSYSKSSYSSYGSSSSKSSSSKSSDSSSSGSYNKKHLGCKVQCQKDYAGVRRCKKVCSGLAYKSKSSKSYYSSSSSKSSSSKSSSSSSSDSCESKKFRHGHQICVKTCCDGKCTKTCSKAGLKFYDAEVAEGAAEVKAAAKVANDAPAPRKRPVRRRKLPNKAGGGGKGKRLRRRKGKGKRRVLRKKAADEPVKA